MHFTRSHAPAWEPPLTESLTYMKYGTTSLTEGGCEPRVVVVWLEPHLQIQRSGVAGVTTAELTTVVQANARVFMHIDLAIQP